KASKASGACSSAISRRKSRAREIRVSSPVAPVSFVGFALFVSFVLMLYPKFSRVFANTAPVTYNERDATVLRSGRRQRALEAERHRGHDVRVAGAAVGRGWRSGSAAFSLRRLPFGVRPHAPDVAVPVAAGRLNGLSARREAPGSAGHTLHGPQD